jgi:hypothetical protein
MTELRNYQPLPAHLDHISRRKLLPPARIHDAVHFHFAALNQQLRLPASISDTAGLEKEIEPQGLSGFFSFAHTMS